MAHIAPQISGDHPPGGGRRAFGLLMAGFVLAISFGAMLIPGVVAVSAPSTTARIASSVDTITPITAVASASPAAIVDSRAPTSRGNEASAIARQPEIDGQREATAIRDREREQASAADDQRKRDEERRKKEQDEAKKRQEERDKRERDDDDDDDE